MGVQLGTTAVEPDLADKPETVELDPFAGGAVGALDASVVAPVWASTAAVTGTDPEGSLVGKVELVQDPVGAG